MFPVVVIRQPGCTPIYLQVREPIEVGREGTGVLLSDPRVSRRHLVLAPTDHGGPAEVAVLDLGSMNGTILAGVRLTSEAILRPGTEIRVGDTTIALVLERDAVAPIAPLEPAALATTVLPSQRAATTPPDAWRRPAGDPGRDVTDDVTDDFDGDPGALSYEPADEAGLDDSWG